VRSFIVMSVDSRLSSGRKYSQVVQALVCEITLLTTGRSLGLILLMFVLPSELSFKNSQGRRFDSVARENHIGFVIACRRN
jgi:hypothetical protein